MGAALGAGVGAVAGGIADDKRPRFRTYVSGHVPSYRYDREVTVAADLPPSGVTYYQLPKEYGVTKNRYTVVMIVPSWSIGHSPHRSGNRINESPRVTKVRPFLFFLRIVRCPHFSLIFSPISFFLVGGTAPNRMPVAFFLNGVHPSFPLRRRKTIKAHWNNLFLRCVCADIGGEHGTK